MFLYILHWPCHIYFLPFCPAQTWEADLQLQSMSSWLLCPLAASWVLQKGGFSWCVGRKRKKIPSLPGLQPLFTVNFTVSVVLFIKPQPQEGDISAMTTVLTGSWLTALCLFSCRSTVGNSSLDANSWVFLHPLWIFILHIPLLNSLQLSF